MFPSAMSAIPSLNLQASSAQANDRVPRLQLPLAPHNNFYAFAVPPKLCSNPWQHLVFPLELVAS